MKQMLAYCGLDCEKCDAYLATLHDDQALREKTAKAWAALNHAPIPPEHIHCQGCRAEGIKTVFCEHLCESRQCALKKGVETCGDCPDLENCPTVGTILENNPEALRNLKGQEKRTKVLVGACLLGENCKYNGGNNYNAAVAAFVQGKEVLSVCPEMMAGMGCPRLPIEIVDGVQFDRDGRNVDAPVQKAVAQILEQLRPEEIACAVLQSRSPTCGVNQLYDGSFTGRLISGSGVFAQCLKDAGYRVIDAEDISNASE